MRSHIDTVTISLKDEGDMEWLDDIFEAFRHVGRLDFEALDHGINFYDNGGRIMCGGAVFAQVNWGGHTQRETAQLMVKGLGCGLVLDWNPVVSHFSTLRKAKITRVDVALDFFDGSFTMLHAWEARKDRTLWRYGKHGRPPKFIPVGDMLEPGPDGRTLYVGLRESDVYGRIYEKGMKEFASLAKGSPNVREQLISLDGGPAFKIGDFVRFEVEFKPKTTILPLEVLTNPDALLAGAYPIAAKLVGCDTPYKRVRVEHQAMADLEAVLLQVSKQYGPSLRSALDIYDEAELLAKIVAAYRSNTLTHKGVRLSTKDDVPKLVQPVES